MQLLIQQLLLMQLPIFQAGLGKHTGYCSPTCPNHWARGGSANLVSWVHHCCAKDHQAHPYITHPPAVGVSSSPAPTSLQSPGADHTQLVWGAAPPAQRHHPHPDAAPQPAGHTGAALMPASARSSGPLCGVIHSSMRCGSSFWTSREKEKQRPAG